MFFFILVFLHLCQSVCSKRRVLKPIRVAEIVIIPWCLIFSNLSTPVHLYYRPQIKSIHVFKRRILVKLVYCENENSRIENFCQVMFCCRHFYCIRIEPHCKHRSIKFLTAQTDQSKRDILIYYVLRRLFRNQAWETVAKLQ